MRWADIGSKDTKKLIKSEGHRTRPMWVDSCASESGRGLEHRSRRIEKLLKLTQAHADLQHQEKVLYVLFRTQTKAGSSLSLAHTQATMENGRAPFFFKDKDSGRQQQPLNLVRQSELSEDHSRD